MPEVVEAAFAVFALGALLQGLGSCVVLPAVLMWLGKRPPVFKNYLSIEQPVASLDCDDDEE